MGRFQPFHLGHLFAIRHASKGVDELIVIVGSSQKSHEFRNPFTAGERIEMIRDTLIGDQDIDEDRILLIPIPDTDIHRFWTFQIDFLVPRYDRVYTNDPFTKYLFSERGISVIQPRMYRRKDLSATRVRMWMVKDKDWHSLVPTRTAKFIEAIDGVRRIKSLFKLSRISSTVYEHSHDV